MEDPAAGGVKRERIALLFVHGVGEQARWEHLRSCVREFGELMRQEAGASVTLVDRTGDWKLPPEAPHSEGTAPMTLTYRAPGHVIDFECHEVWWADLGSRSGGLQDAFFWLWGLGQWCAPIYREVDLAHLPKAKHGFSKPTSDFATLPIPIAGRPAELWARMQLLAAGLAALFIACTWSLAKRLFASLLGTAPSPTLIVQYVGDVRVYTARAAPGETAPGDPGQPIRVGIRRRMVSHMVEVASSGCDGWYVVAHSLGTVVAYNGLTETGHALPNYLSQGQWDGLPGVYKVDPDCRTRADITAMMPSRPGWLRDRDVINRKLLFARLRGFLTYGSPLDKFAGLWPRIVATATDREGEHPNPFPDGMEWLNLACPTDPVAGSLDSYPPARFGGSGLPQVRNLFTPWSPAFGLSHIRYFSGSERHDPSRRSRQKRAIARWLTGAREEIDPGGMHWLARLVSVRLPYLLMLVLLWLAAAALVAAAGGLVTILLGGSAPAFADARAFIAAVAWWLMPLLGGAAGLCLGFGLWRWWRESRLNYRLARFDEEQDDSQKPGYWERMLRMLGLQTIAAATVSLISLVLLALAFLHDWQDSVHLLLGLPAWTGADWLKLPLTYWRTIAVAFLLALIAAAAQALIARLNPAARRAGRQPPPH